MVRQLSIKADWLNAPLALWDLVVAISDTTSKISYSLIEAHYFPVTPVCIYKFQTLPTHQQPTFTATQASFNNTRNTSKNSFTRQTRQKRVTKSQATTHESWLVRCSPCTLGLSGSNQDDINHGRLPILFSCELHSRQVSALATQTHLTPLSQWANLQQICTQALPTITIQSQQSTNKNLLHCP